MSLSSIEFIIQETAANIYRNRLQMLAAVTTVAIGLVILGGFVFVIANLTRLTAETGNQFEISVFLKDLPAAARSQLQGEIRGIPGVRSVELVSKEEAWRKMKAEASGEMPLEGIKENPLPDKFRVRIGDVAQTSRIVEEIHALDKEGKRIDEIRSAQKEAIQLAKLIGFLRASGMVATVLLIVAAAIMISNTLRLTVFARRREIKIMQLVGATSWFIRAPFMLEGMFHGLVGAALACIIVRLGAHYVAQVIHRTLPFAGSWQMPAGMTGMLLGLGVILGAAGSILSIRRFLKI